MIDIPGEQFEREADDTMPDEPKMRWDKWIAIISLLTLLTGVSAWGYTRIWGSAEDHSAIAQNHSDIVQARLDEAADRQRIQAVEQSIMHMDSEAETITGLQRDDAAYQQKLQDILDRLTVIETKMIFIIDQGADRVRPGR